MTQLRVAVATPALRRCQGVAAVARMVDTATFVVVSVHLFSRSGAGAVAALAVVRTLVPALGAPAVLARGGGRSPRRMLARCTAMSAAGSTVTALLVGLRAPVVAILVVAGVTAVALACLRPLVMALLPHHIRGPAELVATNAAAALLDSASTLAGPMLAGVALATLGGSSALWAAALLLTVAAVLVGGSADPPGIVHAPTGTRGSWVRETSEGLRILTRGGSLRVVVLLSSAQTFVRGALQVLVVTLAIDMLAMGEGGVGILLGAIGIGGLVGFPIAVRAARPGRLARTLAVALVAWGGPIALLAVAPPPVALVLFATVGIGNTLVDISSDTLLQRLVPRGELPRALGCFDALLYATMALGAVVAERLLSVTGLRLSLVVVGGLLPVLAVVAWRWLVAMDHRLTVRDADVALLQLNGIFSPLVMATVDHLVLQMDREAYATGETILLKGDAGDRFLLIEEGSVEVVDDGTLLAVLGPGEGFGEMALLHDAPRSATVLARTPVRLRSLARHDFLAMVDGHHGAHAAAHDVAERRRAVSARTDAPSRPSDVPPGVSGASASAEP